MPTKCPEDVVEAKDYHCDLVFVVAVEAMEKGCHIGVQKLWVAVAGKSYHFVLCYAAGVEERATDYHFSVVHCHCAVLSLGVRTFLLWKKQPSIALW